MGAQLCAWSGEVLESLRHLGLMVSAVEHYLRVMERSGQLKNYLPRADPESIRWPIPHPAGVAD